MLHGLVSPVLDELARYTTHTIYPARLGTVQLMFIQKLSIGCSHTKGKERHIIAQSQDRVIWQAYSGIVNTKKPL